MHELPQWITTRDFTDVIATAALIVSLMGVPLAWRAVRAANRSATEAARSAAAAERQAAASERQADAAERSLSAPVAEPIPAVAWQLTRVTKSAYRLRNLGTENAHDVRLQGLPPEAKDLVRFFNGVTVAAGDAVDLMIFQVMGPTVTSIEVRWGDGGCETLSV